MRQADQRHLDWLAHSFGSPDYRPLGPEDLRGLNHIGEVVSLPFGADLFREGDQATALFVVSAGEVEISRGNGAMRRVLAVTGPESVLGDVAVFADTAHIASARTSTATNVWRFDRSRLLPELAIQPGIMFRWLVSALRRTEEAQLRLVRLSEKPVLAQVADLLSEESLGHPDVRLSQATIGALLGVSRQSVNEALSRLRDQGVVETAYRSIRIVDLPRLAEISVG
ncbi:MAG TPA: Crp/Fnr family transcriptional regulator [Acidimicrobiia bacterium]|nr:Crp/Fnr family transcriptional regulator [Acidimicrobiia bacterium]